MCRELLICNKYQGEADRYYKSIQNSHLEVFFPFSIPTCNLTCLLRYK